MSRQTLTNGTGAVAARKAMFAAIMGTAPLDRRGGPRVVRGPDFENNALLALEQRRMMSGDAGGYLAGLVELRDGTLRLDADSNAAAAMTVELDADGSHVRGVVEGKHGDRAVGDWHEVADVRRVRVAGGEAQDRVDLDARLATTDIHVDVDADVEHVRVAHEGGREADHARRLARRIGEANGAATITAVGVTRSAPDVTSEPDRQDAPIVAGLHVLDYDRPNDGITGLPRLADEMTVDLAEHGTNLALVADVWGDAFEGSVRFTIDGPGGTTTRVENWHAYSVFGDDLDGRMPTGTYSVTATAFTGRRATGEAGGSLTVKFTLIDSRQDANDDGVTPPPVLDRQDDGDADDGDHVDPPFLPPPDSTGDQGDSDAVDVRITAVHNAITAGHAVHLSGIDTTLDNGGQEDAVFEWDFGDAGSDHNVVRGFVAAHVYDEPGTYTARLTVVDEAGNRSTREFTVDVSAADRRLIHVDADGGDDRNDGLGESTAVRTAARAAELLAGHGDGVEVRFKAGQTHYLNSPLSVTQDDVVVTRYGEAGLSRPALVWTGQRSDRFSMVESFAGSEMLTVRGLSFDNHGAHGTRGKGNANAVRPAGRGTAVLDSEFLNVDNAVVANMSPTGLLVQGNAAPLEGGVRGYFVWGQGEQITVLGNTAVNSTREHIVRASSGVRGVTVAGNDFSNLDRRDGADAGDHAKGTIVIQHGSHAYVSGNRVTGPAGVGPLGDGDGLIVRDSRFDTAVWEGNLHRQGSTVFFEHGSQHVDFRGNVLRADGRTALLVEGYDADYDRRVVDLDIAGNTVVNLGQRGKFAWVFGGNRGLELTDNTYVAPNLKVGHYGAAALMISADDLSGFDRIAGNTWPAAPAGGGWTQGGNVALGAGHGPQNYRDPSEWNALPGVGGDAFADVDLATLNAHGVPVLLAA